MGEENTVRILMVDALAITWWVWAILVIVCILLVTCAVLKLHEKGIYPLRDATQFVHRPAFEVLLIVFMTAGLIQYGATKGTNGTNQALSPSLMTTPPNSSGTGFALGGVDADGRITNLCFTDIHPLSNAVCLALAWPTNFFRDGSTLDFFSKVDALTNGWDWIGSESVVAGSTNLDVEIPYPMGGQMPAIMFFTAKDRNSFASTMRDWDSDGIPDVYELHYETNPYVADSEQIPRLTVGANGDYQTIEAALAASAAYSVVDVESGVFETAQQIVMPPHPVILEGPLTGYAVLRSSAEIGAVMLTDRQDERTLFRNLIVELRARKGFQAGFWVGGGVPWMGYGAAATFENVHVRAQYPGVEHFGWLFYRDESGPSRLIGCTMNAAGSTWAYGVSMYNAASNVIENCTFLNMPTNVGEIEPIAVLVRDASNTVGSREPPEPRSDLSWAGYPLSASYDRLTDSDGDGVSDYDEVFTYDTDPWLSDSDGDGIGDGDEIWDESDPKNLNSHPHEFVIRVTNTVFHASMTNYVFFGSVDGWETNLLFACSDYGGAMDICTNASFGATMLCAFRDLNRNGIFEPDYDILLTNDVSGIEAVKSVCFAFGDVDGDGVSDMQERADGTDPYSKLSLTILRKIKITNSDPTRGITNYWFVGASPDSAEATWVSAVGQTVIPEMQVTGTAINGCLYAVVYRDFNRNGRFDEGVDAIATNLIYSGSSLASFAVGDIDSDGIKDGEEIAEGTDPLDEKSYCYQAELKVVEIFTTTNMLSYQATFDGVVVFPTAIVDTNELVLSLGHHETTNRSEFMVWFWDDWNRNGVRDEGEPCSSVVVGHASHTVNMTVSMPYGGFDTDHNGLLDWWEDVTGLNEFDGRSCDMDDTDGDGLVNYHEYLTGCNPLLPDGSNTLLSVCVRSIDERIRGKDAELSMELLTHYLENAEELRFVRNATNWLADVDFSCMGVWTEQGPSNQRAPVAISSNHVVLATHWPVDVGNYVWFVDRNGNVISNAIKAIRSISIPGHSIWDVDVSIALLREPLPASVSTVKLFPKSIRKKLGDGKRMPVVQINQEKEARVAELISLTLSETRHNSYTSLTQPWRREFSKTIRGGDSGSPTFAIVGNQLVLLGLHHTVSTDPAYWALVEEIQAAIDFLSPMNNDRLQILDVNEYPDVLHGGEP